MAKVIKSLTPSARRAKKNSDNTVVAPLPPKTKFGVRAKAEDERRAKRKAERINSTVPARRDMLSNEETEVIRDSKQSVSPALFKGKTPRQRARLLNPKRAAAFEKLLAKDENIVQD